MLKKILPKNLDRQAAITISTILIIFLSVFNYISYQRVIHHLETGLQEKALLISSNIAKIVESNSQSFENTALNVTASSDFQLPEFENIAIFNPDGQVVYNKNQGSDKDSSTQENIPLPNLAEVHVTTTSETVSAWSPIYLDQKVHWVKVQLSTDQLKHKANDLLVINGFFTLLTVLGATVFILFFFRKPIRYIRDAANYAEFIDSSSRKKLPIYTNSTELKRLGEALNLASNRLLINEKETMAAFEDLEAQKSAMDEHAIVSITDVKGCITYANNKFCQISGFAQKELLNNSHSILRSGRHDEAFYHDLWNTILQGKVWKGAICNKTKSGEEFWTDTTIVPYLDINNKPYQFAAIRNDITALKLATQKLFESEQRLQQSQNFAGIGSWEIQLDTRKIILSESALKLLGNPDTTSITHSDHYIKYIHPDDRLDVIHAVKSCIDSGKNYQTEYRVIWPDESIHWLQSNGNILYNDEGKPIKILGMSQDITKQHQTAEQMEILARFPNENPNPVMRVSHDMSLLYCNPAGQELMKFWGIKEGDKIPEEIARIAQDNIEKQQSTTLDIESNKKHYTVTVAFVPKAEYLNLYMKDSTLRKIAEKQVKIYQKHLEDLVDERTADLVKARDDALVAERSMSTFLTNMTHELRTPLHAILSFADFGIKKIDRAPQEKLLSYFSKIHQSGSNLLELVNNLLDLSKLKSGKMNYNFTEIDINSTIQQVINELSILAENKNIELDIQQLENISVIHADRIRIQQVIRNLLSNAIKFSEENDKISISQETKKEGIIIRIEDNGIGIPENELESIFDSFSQSSITVSSAGGTGLGLPICKEIIESGHQGWKKANNSPSKGAIFSFFIPKVETKHQPQRKAS